MFKTIMEKFNRENKATIVDAKYGPYSIRYKFADFPKIISKPTFLTYISTSFDYQFSSSAMNAIEDEIDFLRDLFNTTNKAAERYLGELSSDHDSEITYKDFLINIYSETKNFISMHLIGWIFDGALHSNAAEAGIEYDSELYYQFQKEILKLGYEKQLRKVIKLLKKDQPTDSTFELLDNQYEFDINNKQMTIRDLKAKARIG